MNSARQEREIKGIHVGKKDIILSLLIDDMIIYVENLKESTKNSRNLLRIISTAFGKIQIHKVQSFSYISAMKKWNLKLKTQYHFPLHPPK